MTNPNGRPSGGIAWTELAETDRSVARQLAGAERSRMATSDRIADQDAAADRAMRLAERRQRLDVERQREQDDRRERRRRDRGQAKIESRGRRLARRRAAAAEWRGRIDSVRGNAAAVYSGTIYSLAVSGAVYGQVDAAVTHGLPWPVGAVTAVAIEGTGLSMALTAQEQRLRGERALAARSLVWLATATAVGVNYGGHVEESPTMAYGLAALSALGITVWEVRSAAKHRKALRKAGMIPEPMTRFGWRRWLRFPGPTWAAWTLDVQRRVPADAAKLFVDVEKAAAASAAAEESARLEAQRRRMQRQTAGLARRAAKAAVKRGESGPALVALVAMARGELLALPAAADLELPPPAEKVERHRLKLTSSRERVVHRPKRHPGGPTAKQVAAYAAKHPEKTIEQVATALGTSKATVNRRLREAKESGPNGSAEREETP